jgi:hypothetical protein
MTTRRLALAGLVGPPLFAAIVLLVTGLEWDFLHSVGWSARPFDSPDALWPSSAALGDYGFLVELAFLLLGVSVLALGLALFRVVGVRGRFGPGVVMVLGAAWVLAAVRTDYRTAYGGGPNTWHGTVHLLAFSIFVPAAAASMLSLAAQFGRDARWRALGGGTLVAGLVAIASIAAFIAFGENVFLWIFLAVVLTWLTFVSARALALS